MISCSRLSSGRQKADVALLKRWSLFQQFLPKCKFAGDEECDRLQFTADDELQKHGLSPLQVVDHISMP